MIKLTIKSSLVKNHETVLIQSTDFRLLLALPAIAIQWEKPRVSMLNQDTIQHSRRLFFLDTSKTLIRIIIPKNHYPAVKIITASKIMRMLIKQATGMTSNNFF